MLELNVGDVVKMTSPTIVAGDGRETIRASYRARKGRRMVFLYLGDEASDGSAPQNYIERMKALGWVPSKKLETEFKEDGKIDK